MALTDKLSAIGEAIRGKTGKTDLLTLDEMPQEISSISAGGSADNTVLYSLLGNTITEFIDNDITYIGAYAFANKSSLVTVNMPNVTEMKNNVFQSCSKLTNLYIPKVTYLEAYTFQSAGIKEVNLPSVTEMGTDVFYYSKTEKAMFPNLTLLQQRAFRSASNLQVADLGMIENLPQNCFQSCSKLNTLILRKFTIHCTLENVNAFTGTPFAVGGTGGTIYVPSARIALYQSATNWKDLVAAGTVTFAALEGSEYE